MLALAEFDLRYEAPKAIKGQVLADLVVEHDGDEEAYIEPMPWMLFFDGSACRQGCGIGLVIISPRRASFEFSFLVETCTNNQVEYQAILKGLQLLSEAGADTIEIVADSLLVLSQLAEEYECKDDVLQSSFCFFKKIRLS